MGGDGGVIANQRKFIRGVKGDEKDDGRNLREHQTMRTITCTLTSEPLTEPIVACELGNLYNKEAIITALLEKSLPNSLAHVRGLRDLQTVRWTINSNNGQEPGAAKYICPVTRTEFSGSLPFVIIWPTGFVLSEKAILEIGISGLQEEYGPFTADDIVRLLPTEEEQPEQMARMTIRHSQSKSKKQKNPDKKRKLPADARPITESTAATAPVTLGVTGTVTSLAAKAIEAQSEASTIYKKLFHKDHEADKHDRDLFMSIAGMRYTLG